MKIYQPTASSVTDTAPFNDENSFTRISASVSNGVATIKRRMFFQAENKSEDAGDILALAKFPQSGAAHPKYPHFRYQGNCTIAPISNNSDIWYAELDYTTTNLSSKQDDGDPIDSNTKPWNLPAENVHWRIEERSVPFTASFDKSNYAYDQNNAGNRPLVPVCNSAGDMYKAEKIAYQATLSFSYYVKDLNIKTILERIGSINANSITVAGVTIPAQTAIIKELSPEYISEPSETDPDNGYWKIAVSILMDPERDVIYRRFLDVGDRAKFKAVDLSEDAILSMAMPNATTTLAATPQPSQICRFRLTNNIGTAALPDFSPTGKEVYCSWLQFLDAIKLYRKASIRLQKRKNPLINTIYVPECEQLTQMPLNGNGYLYQSAIPGNTLEDPPLLYKSRLFRDHPLLPWSSLGFPKKGVK